MPRWKAPPTRSSPYITAAGAQALREELRQLWKQQRPEVVRALAAAAAEGDRSENAEYTYRKKQLGEIDRRIRYLSKRLDQIEVVDRLPDDQGVVRFGAWVVVEDDAGAERIFRIVGADETHAQRGWISVDSPVAGALLGKSAGAEIRVELPDGVVHYTVLRVRYRPE
ncbi:MAG: transcription elongation factor GreB [Xanthomonadales bacterium]|nr:transcription elongation factor GreB [Xanthomonadales bacterium]NIN59019.1 transcription elongation factor GreB [Xanthomonadales bacterium]NIN74949.1 transcription elongation factor GreB [Xanthomonadales bacterium]NIO13366.1 transcription elongation factor GreB [Xanthomonadales bacterium]NIP11412.1 transcription elongation factor GreB [Xanthomonadales bacterium]